MNNINFLELSKPLYPVFILYKFKYTIFFIPYYKYILKNGKL